jgi:transcriptional regulator with XRE-family HTH domain
MPEITPLSLRIKEVRKTLSMTQTEFAKAVCISNTYLASVETGYRKVNERLIKLIAAVFGVSETWLSAGKGDMFLQSPTEKRERLINCFNELPPDFQDYVLQQVEQLLRLQKQAAGTPDTTAN